MKVLWVCNIMLPVIAEKLDMPYSNREGWLSGLVERLLNKNSGIQLGICFPVDKNSDRTEWELTFSETVTCKCYGFEENLLKPEKYARSLEKRFKKIIADFKPDMIHVFGTEFPHTLAAVKVFGKPDKTLIGMQGVCSALAEVYLDHLPFRVKNIPTLRDILRRDSLKRQQRRFVKRGRNEIKALKLTGHVTGRTDFDRETVSRINPGAEYHFMNETMRSCFYKDSWNSDNCERYSIFVSQADYPIKGFHFLIQAMPKVLERYPETVVYVAGANLLQEDTWKDRLKRSGYGKYLKKLIWQNGLQDHVYMLGRLSAEEMKRQYLGCNIFVVPSVLENSPNSLGEAMLLGVPCIAAKVGGIPNLLEEGRDGMLFPGADPDALANAIIEMFTKEELARLYSINAKRHAYRTHDGDDNYHRLLEIYEAIAGEKEES